MLEAVFLSELTFTKIYHKHDPTTKVLFKDWINGHHVEMKFGKPRMKIANPYMIKWKTRWTLPMVLKDMKVRRVWWPFLYYLSRYATTRRLYVQYARKKGYWGRP
jgi:hypothetical protein